MVFDASMLSTKYYMVQIKSKWSKPEKEVELSSKPRGSSYIKGSLRVTVDHVQQTYIYI